jgi:hypothetical protein
MKVSRRFAVLLLAAVVAVITLSVGVHAVQSATLPNAVSISYTLAPGANSADVTPVTDKPVMILGDQIGTASGVDDVGSSLMTVVNSSEDRELVWNGFESARGGLTSGFSPTAGTHIMFIDNGHLVDLEVTNATSFHVHNSSASSPTYNGNVTLIW